ncbi:MAG TPA: metal-dependent hydrolase [Aliiroseovarius sp.]|nr:metal-dependent hydrolase [Aliiroseovarius sp.]
MRLATYNMRKAIGLDRRRDPKRIIDVINSLDADVVVLQEADRRLGPRPSALPRTLIEHETSFTPAPLAENNVSLGFHGNAILVRRDLKIGQIERVHLPGLEPRGAVMADIDDRLRVVGVHLGLMRRHRREQLSDIIRRVTDSPLPVAILGDFNEWSLVQGLGQVAKQFTLCTPGRSYHSARPVAALDRVALSQGIDLVDAGVQQSKRARVASDHLPVWVDVDFTPPA